MCFLHPKMPISRRFRTQVCLHNPGRPQARLLAWRDLPHFTPFLYLLPFSQKVSGCVWGLRQWWLSQSSPPKLFCTEATWLGPQEKG